jgi:hypothetical protein
MPVYPFPAEAKEAKKSLAQAPDAKDGKKKESHIRTHQAQPNKDGTLKPMLVRNQEMKLNAIQPVAINTVLHLIEHAVKMLIVSQKKT